MGMFVNYFFAGFILGKVPFQLSPSFRLMLQRGIDLPSLDVTYFTSLSYYILLLFGFQGVFRIVFRCAYTLAATLKPYTLSLRLNYRAYWVSLSPTT